MRTLHSDELKAVAGGVNPHLTTISVTTNPGGVGKWQASYTAVLAGAIVGVVADRDEPGRQHAHNVAAQLRAAGCTVTVLEPSFGKDVAEHLGAGRTMLQLVSLEAPRPEPVPIAAATGSGLITERLADVKAERVRWLWHGRLPLGKITVLDGLPDMGKSTVAIDLTARVSKGLPMPDGSDGLEHPAPVVMFTAEDGLADTVKPRLLAAGGADDLVHVVTATRVLDEEGNVRARWPDLTADVDKLGALVAMLDARLVVVDVLMAYLGARTNSYRDQDVRALLGPLSAMAEETRCAVLLLRHPTKAANRDPVLYGGGSIGIMGAARVGLLASLHPDDVELPEADRRRLLAVAKCNIAPKAETMVYRLVPAPDPEFEVARVSWEGTSGLRAADLLAEPSDTDEADARNEAERFVLSYFGDEDAVRAADILKEASANKITPSTLRRARIRLRIDTERVGFGPSAEYWWMRSPQSSPDMESTMHAMDSTF